MTQAQQSEAQRLAAICETKGMFPVADELNRMHARILELEQGKCLHQIAEPAAQGLDAHGCDMFWVADDPDGQHDTLHEAVVRAFEDGGIQPDGTVEIQCAKSIPNILVRISGITPFAFEIVPDAALAEGGAA